MEHLPTISDVHALYRLAIGAGLGSLIGLERQWRQRMAGGFQTCALVAVGSTLYTLVTPLIFHGNGDPTRVVGQITTGIGFLAGGVILKEGMNVRGLNTAATIWATGAVGALAGLGFFIEASCGAAVIAALNWLIGPIADVIDRHGRTRREAHFQVDVTCRADAEAATTAFLVSAINSTTYTLTARHRANGPEPGTVKLDFEFAASRHDDALIAEFVDKIRSQPGVIDAALSAYVS